MREIRAPGLGEPAVDSEPARLDRLEAGRLQPHGPAVFDFTCH